MTLNGWNVTLAEINKIYVAHHKNFNEDRPILLAAKCRPIIVVSKNIRHMRIFVGVPREGRQLFSNDSNERSVIVNFNTCTYLFAANMCHLATPNWPLCQCQSSICPYFFGRQDVVTWAWMNKKAVLSQRRRRNAPYISLPWNFWRVPDYAHAPLSPKFLTAFCSDVCECSGQIWSSYSFKRSWELGAPHKFWQSLYTPTLRFLHNF